MRSWFSSWPRAVSFAVLCAMFIPLLAVVPANAYDCMPCSAPDNGSGTVAYPTPCPHKPCCGQTAEIKDGLPQGSTIQIPIEIIALSLRSVPGGMLGGEVITFDGQLHLPMTGTGSLSGFSKYLTVPGTGEIHTAPRTPGNDIQGFDTEMRKLQGQLPSGDPDFDLLRITAGTDFGMPSPGHTTLTRSSSNDWSVDSFFDITYRIDFIGAPGGPLAGRSGSTTGTIRVYQGCPNWVTGGDHKMHFPQLPDEAGWDVNATYPNVLADDWQCSETGPVKDIHFWGSWMHGNVGKIKAFHLKIYSDVPKNTDAPYSHPGNILWQGVFTDFGMIPIRPGSLEGWYEPAGTALFPGDHNEYWQYDFLLEQAQWFQQTAGTIYWLCVSAELEQGQIGYQWGWKSSTVQFNDDAVYVPPLTGQWHDLYKPLAFTESMDLSFVITGGTGVVTGACCDPNGNCFVATSLDCGLQGGNYLGDGTACLGDNDGDGVDDACGASTVRGACCLPNGTCAVLTQSKCLSGGGLYLGDGSVCLGDNDGDGRDDACETPTKRGACCWPNGTCSVVTQDKCVTNGGTYLGDGSPCLGDLNGNGTDDACERPNPDFKWEQMPDLQPTGMDVYASVGAGIPPYVLADDFLCTVTGPITEIHVFGSWRLDRLPFGDPRRVRFNLSIHSDIPAGPLGGYSRPGDLLCLLQDLDFKVKPYGVELREGWMLPPFQWSPWPNGDRVCWEYIFYLSDNTCIQHGTAANPVVYWLDVQAIPDEQGTFFGWKTAIPPHRIDDATWAIGTDIPTTILSWKDLAYPPNHQFSGQSIDLAFKIFGHNGTPRTGACCWPDGTCSVVTRSQCENSANGLFGTYKGDGTVCAGDNNGNGVDDACEQVLPTGACCYTGAAGPTCTNTTQAQCLLTYGGTWYPGQNCANFTCPQQPPQGACCYPDPAGVMHCISTTHKECVKVYGGTWYLGQTCATIDCPTPQPMGACCYGDPANPSCVNTTQDLCKTKYNGTWYAGQNCATFDCPTTIPLGACCFREPGTTIQSCVNTSQAACVQVYGGTWYAGQNCTTFNCPTQPPLGACCYEGAAGPTCIDATQADCHAKYGGTWHAGVTCATYQCTVSHDLGACCFLNAAGVYGCANTTQLDCNAVYGGTWYAGMDCATFQCPTPVPTGACCYGTPSQCVTTTEDQCKSAYGGTWTAGQSCTTFQCGPTSCCVGRVGDANGSHEPTDEVTLGDIMLMVDVKFISGDCSKLPCLTEADVNQDGGATPNCDDHVTLGDIMTLVDFLFISGPENATLRDCL